MTKIISLENTVEYLKELIKIKHSQHFEEIFRHSLVNVRLQISYLTCCDLLHDAILYDSREIALFIVKYMTGTNYKVSKQTWRDIDGTFDEPLVKKRLTKCDNWCESEQEDYTHVVLLNDCVYIGQIKHK